MKKISAKTIAVLYLVLFLAFLCLPWGIWGIRSCFVETSDADSGENRTLAAFPSLSFKKIRTFPEKFDLWLNDHIPFRNGLIRINAALETTTSPFMINSVIIGKNDWLFYGESNDGEDLLADYWGTKLYTEAELEQIADNCRGMQELMASQGREFVIAIFPNKERIYTEYLPDKMGAPAEVYRTLQIVDYLRANTTIPVVYPYDALIRAKETYAEGGYTVWLRTDTHMNALGSYVACSELLRELGIEIPIPTCDQISTQVDEYVGDLLTISRLQRTVPDNTYYRVSPDCFKPLVRQEAEDTLIYHLYSLAEDHDPRTVYMINDSFGSGIRVYLGHCFEEVHTGWKNISYSYDNLLAADPDVVIFETVERFAGQLLNFDFTYTE